ncbi:hypothetical protein ACS0TY_004460 [Phlomoides rotata]
MEEALFNDVDYIVVTSVDRDDLPDGGSGHFTETVKAMKILKPDIMVECLTSDFRGDIKAVSTLVHSGLDVFAHNVETVKRLQWIVRDPWAGYEQSLIVLKHAKLSKEGMITKTSIMLGLGETDDELKEAMADLRAIGVQSSYRAGELFVKTMVKKERAKNSGNKKSLNSRRSGQTVSHYVHIVLRAVLSLHTLFLVKPTPVTDDSTDSRWKWFKAK